MSEILYDDWWHSLPEERKAQLHRWITQGHGANSEPLPGQLALVPDPTE